MDMKYLLEQSIIHSRKARNMTAIISYVIDKTLYETLAFGVTV